MSIHAISIRSRNGALAAAFAAALLVAAPVGAAFAGDPRVDGAGAIQLADSPSGHEPWDRGCAAADSTPDLYQGSGWALCNATQQG
jgi:hypothetical protein